MVDKISDKIMKDARYIDRLNAINEHEATRIYCKHDMAHSMEVARILIDLSSRKKLDDNVELSKIMAYLHDIGRPDCYGNDKEHSKAGAEFAKVILEEYGMDLYTIELICFAINNHSGRMSHDIIDNYINNVDEDNLFDTWAKLLCIADQLSRNCYECKAYDLCNWSIEEKNNEAWKC